MEDNNSLTEQLILSPEPAVGSDENSEVGPRADDREEQDEDTTTTEQAWTRGEKQPIRFRDAPFAVLFYLQVISIVAVALFVPVEETTGGKDETDETTKSRRGLLFFSLVVAGLSFMLAAMSLAVMTMYSQTLVQASLLFSIVLSILMAVLALLENNGLLAVLGGVLAVIACCYACAVWRRIPFAAANLKTGLAAVKANYGVIFIAYFFVALSVVYLAVILFDMVAVFSQTSQCKDGACEEGSTGGIFLFLFLLALFWTQQVIKNTVHVSVAGTVGEWWFDPNNGSSFCSGAIWGSFLRATTYSFGSICLGSLLVALIQTLRQIVYNARRNSEGNNILLCIAECILGCLENLAQYFNKWAYIYVGLYGYTYIEAGMNVMTLFKQRGWTTIITDDLVSSTLSLVCMVLAGLSGCAGIVLNAACVSWLEDMGDSSAGGAFLIAFIIGLVISSTLMGVVDSAVNTIIVCFAEAPAEGQANHHDLCEEMKGAWMNIYPDACGF